MVAGDIVYDTDKSFVTEAAAELIEAKSAAGKAERSIWYHGTDPKNLRSILSHGLKADHKDKNWGDDPHKGKRQLDRTSYGGVYFARNIGAAMSASWKGRMHGRDGGSLLVIASLQDRSLKADEDRIAPYLADPTVKGFGRLSPDGAAGLWMMAHAPERTPTTRKNKDALEEFYEKYADDFLEQYVGLYNQGKPLDPKREDVARKALREAAIAAIERMTGHFADENGKHWRYEWTRNWRYFVDPKAEDESIPDPPSHREGEARFRAAVDKITGILSNSARPSKTGVTRNVSRAVSDVKFSGANKIVAVVEMDSHEDPKKGYVLTVHYGSLPQGFDADWNASFEGTPYTVRER